MEKNFDEWNTIKKSLHSNGTQKLYHEREIWWCALGANIGFEQDGSGKDRQRPVLIIRSTSPNTCYVLPFTTSSKRHKYRVTIGFVEGKKATAVLSQMRLIDTKRLVNKVCFLDKEMFTNIRKAIKGLF